MKKTDCSVSAPARNYVAPETEISDCDGNRSVCQDSTAKPLEDEEEVDWGGYLPIFLIFLSLMAVSCMKEVTEPEEHTSVEAAGQMHPEAGTHSITACTKEDEPSSSATESGDTKIVLENGKYLRWQTTSDAIGIYDDDGVKTDPAGGDNYSLGSRQTKRYVCSEVSGGGAVATFTSTDAAAVAVDGKSVYYAVFPDYGQAVWEQGKMLQWLSEKQKVVPAAGNIPVNANGTSQLKSVAKSAEKDGPYVFSTVTSLFKFNVSAADAGVITEIRARTLSYDLEGGRKQALGPTEYLGGNFTIDYSGDTPATSLCWWPHTQPDGSTELGGSTDIYAGLSTASCYPRLILYPQEGENGGGTFPEGSFYMSVLPGTYMHELMFSFMTRENDGFGQEQEYTYVRGLYGKKVFKPNTPYNLGYCSRPGAVTKADADADGITFPYVFSLRCNSLSVPKDVTYTAGTKNASTQTSKDVMTDAASGATLQIFANHRTSAADVQLWSYDEAARDGYAKDDISVNYANYDGTGADKKPITDAKKYESGYFFTFPLAQDAPKRMRLSFGLRGGQYACRGWSVLYSSDPGGWWCRLPAAAYATGDFYHLSNKDVYDEISLCIEPPASMLNKLKAGNNLYVKIVPSGLNNCDGGIVNFLDGQLGIGKSATSAVTLFSSVVLSSAEEESTSVPTGAETFLPFDGNTSGVDIRSNYSSTGDKTGRLGSFTNLDGGAYDPSSDESAYSVSGTSWSASNCRVRPAYLQVGAVRSSAVEPASWTCSKGTLTSPAFSTAGDYRLTFKAMGYETNGRATAADVLSPDADSFKLTLSDGAVFTEGGENGSLAAVGAAVAQPSLASSLSRTSGAHPGRFGEYTYNIYGATAGTQLTFSGADGADFSRFFLDDICLTRLGATLTATSAETSSSTLNFTWQTQGATAAQDVARAWDIALYSDAGCTDEVVSYSIPAGSGAWGGLRPKFCFAGLTQNTSYYFRVRESGSERWSNVVSATTDTFDLNCVTSDAAVGDVILAEDFHSLTNGGEGVAVSAGYGYNGTGSTAVSDKTFNKGTDDYTAAAATRWTQSGGEISQWGYWSSAGGASLYFHQGHIKLGTISGQSYLVSPMLAAIPEGKAATIKVQVTAAAYAASTDHTNVVAGIVSVETGGSLNADHLYSGLTSNPFDNSKTFSMAGTNTVWTTYTVTLSDVSSSSRLMIGAASNVKNNRINISDVKVTVTALKQQE